ncbi:MAG: cytochrome c [Novosphingobium sp.]
MRITYAVLPLLALGLAACGESKDASETAAPASEAATTAASAPAAVASVSAEEGAKIAKQRHDDFEAIGKAMKGVGDELKKSSPNVDTIKANAAKIAEAAPKVKDWFPAGSGVEVAPKSEALPAIWEKPADFQKAHDKFAAEAVAFNTTAQTGDLARIGDGMKALGGTCKGCHDEFRKKDD